VSEREREIENERSPVNLHMGVSVVEVPTLDNCEASEDIIPKRTEGQRQW
jgi:hypothetical protein